MFTQRYLYYIVASLESSLDLESNEHKTVLVRITSAIITLPKEVIIFGNCNLYQVRKKKGACPENVTVSPLTRLAAVYRPRAHAQSGLG
jgi:hypothetical protein